MAITWSLVSAPLAVNITGLIVPDSYTWERPRETRRLRDPCGPGSTLLVEYTGTLPKRVGAPVFQIFAPAVRATVVAALEDAFAKVGPFTLNTPTEVLTVQVDTAVGGWRIQNVGYTTLVSFGLAEV